MLPHVHNAFAHSLLLPPHRDLFLKLSPHLGRLDTTFIMDQQQARTAPRTLATAEWAGYDDLAERLVVDGDKRPIQMQNRWVLCSMCLVAGGFLLLFSINSIQCVKKGLAAYRR